MGLYLDSAGSVILWLDAGATVIREDITALFGNATDVVMRLTVDGGNNLSAELDFGADGSVDLVRNNYGTLQYLGGAYTGSFESYVTAVPVPAAVWLFGSALLGLVGIKRKQ